MIARVGKVRLTYLEESGNSESGNAADDLP